MLIAITKKVLQDPGEAYLFRPNTITALKMIAGGGRSLLITPDSLSSQQSKVLEQEGIFFLSEGTPDFEIKGKKESLVLLCEKEEVVSGEGWERLVKYISREARKAVIQRKTKETDIEIEVNLDGTGKSEISTGLKFFDHMLEQISRHGLIDMKLTCKGDLEVDEHHTIEDVAIALGEVISKALGSREGVERYGFILPMDEAQARVAIDLSGRPFLLFEADFIREYVGDLPTEMVKHFFYSFAMNLKASIHVNIDGENDHHQVEAGFKGLARALKMAVEQNERIEGQIPSSKGTL
ncbi:MAG: imidazoleglycerol-phosphate dehydratase HisB [Balneolaceae bacterium]